jgi:hypothetical protein
MVGYLEEKISLKRNLNTDRGETWGVSGLVWSGMTRFWEDIWHEGKTLAKVYPRLYNLSLNHNVTVQKVVTSFGGCLIFRRGLWGDLAGEWCKLLDVIHGVVLSLGDDKVTWTLGNKGFTVKSL